MRRNLIETILGGVVLVVAALFLVFVYSNASLRAVQGYEVFAKFDRVDGLNEGGDVRISGIKIGTITSQDIDPETYLAVVRMSIDPKVKLPADSVAEVVSDGLLGNKYLSVVPGAEDEMIEPGGEIRFTQSSINLVDLVGRYLFSEPEKGGESQLPAS